MNIPPDERLRLLTQLTAALLTSGHYDPRINAEVLMDAENLLGELEQRAANAGSPNLHSASAHWHASSEWPRVDPDGDPFPRGPGGE